MTPQELATQIRAMDYDYLINAALDRVPDTMDKRQGAIIFDALAPAAYVMTELVMNVADATLQTFTQTATDEFLDFKAEERGLKREPATKADVLAKATDEDGQPLNLSIGDRFASIGADPIYYEVTKLSTVAGQATLTAEALGELGNSYVGQLLPISAISRFGNAEILELTVPARDVETDEELRERLLKANATINFGGNVSDYIEFVTGLEDISAVQVYPTWNGGGTVKIAVLNNQFLAPSQDLIKDTQNAIDPLDAQGDGYGIAPIGHTVTVVAPTLRTINVSVQIATKPAVTVEDVRQQIEKAIADYIASVRKVWGTIRADNRTYEVTLFRSQIIVSLLKIEGIVNATSILFDGKDEDLKLVTDSTTEELPMIGTVAIND